MNCFWIYYELSRTQDFDTREDCVEHFDIISTLILLAQSAKRILAVFASVKFRNASRISLMSLHPCWAIQSQRGSGFFDVIMTGSFAVRQSIR
jgi:hypothetical protein